MKKLLFIILSLIINVVYADPLPPEQVFHFKAKIEGNSIFIYGTTELNYKLYKDGIKIINNKSLVKLDDIIKPKGLKEYNEFLDKYQEEYEGDFLMEIPFKGKGNIEFDIESQGCTKGLCYSPFVTHIKLKK